MTSVFDPLAQGDLFDPSTIVWVTSQKGIPGLIRAIYDASEVVIDLETTGLDEHAVAGDVWPVSARIVFASLTLPMADDPLNMRPPTYAVPLSHPDSPLRGVWKAAVTQIVRALADSGKPITNHNLKFDLRWLHAFTDVDLSGNFSWDTQIASHLLDETISTKLKERVPLTFGIDRWDDHDLSTPGAAERVPLFDLGVYAARDTVWAWRLAVYQRTIMGVGAEGEHLEAPETPEEVEHRRLGKLAVWCAMPTSATLTDMEQRGFTLDTEWVQNELATLREISSQAWEKLIDRYPMSRAREDASFAPTSLWFKEWTQGACAAGDLRVASLTPNGAPQWSKSVLTRQARAGSEAAQLLLDYRGAVKGQEFLNSWLECQTPKGLIHATYNAGRVVTGRLSCVAPDTLIDMPRNMTTHPDGVPISEVKVGDWVYSFDIHMELTLRQVEWVGPTKVDKTIFVTFENSEGDKRVLQCTPDHLVRLYNGDWRHAEYLLKNTGSYGEASISSRVLGMVRRSWKNPGKNDNYLQFFPHSNSRHQAPSVNEGSRNGSTSGGKNTEHRWVMERVLGKKLSTKWDVNHRDGNKVNNHPSNLEYLSASAHRRNTRKDGTWGKPQEWSETFVGKTNFRVVDIADGPTIEVWDMTVPVDHQFVANGIVVHNSSNPNMQQIAKALRPAWIPRPGYFIADLDYSQIELRIAAFISRSEPMMQAYRDGLDLHTMIAARTAGRTEGEVTKAERNKGKAINFGYLFGLSAAGFREYAETAYNVMVTDDEAEASRAAFFTQWNGIAQWHERSRRKVQANGQVVSPIGRVRRLPDIYDANPRLSSHAERNAINAPVQGFASDLMQMAAASISGHLPGHTAVPRVHLLATVHDSVVLEVPIDDWKLSTARCMRRMLNLNDVLKRMGCDLDVPLGVEATVGTRWGLGDIGVIT